MAGTVRTPKCTHSSLASRSDAQQGGLPNLPLVIEDSEDGDVSLCVRAEELSAPDSEPVINGDYDGF